MAEELGRFVPYVGGPACASCLIPPLETLCTVEDTTVRERAVAALNEVASSLSTDHVLEHFVPLVRRLATADWFTSRISACSLFTVTYPRLPAASRGEVRSTFRSLCRDDTPMVRRAASSALGAFAAVVERDVLRTELMPLFVTLSSDDQDSVRLLAVENCVALGKLLDPEDARATVLPTTRSAASDKSWRVRYVVAEQYVDLCDALGPAVTQTELMPAFLKLLRDHEPEVRTAAAFKATGVCERLAAAAVEGGDGADGERPGLQHVVDDVLPCVQELCEDSSQHVRAAMASVIMGLGPILGRPRTVDHLLPLVLKLLRDDYPEVRLNVISRLHEVNSVIGVDLLAQSLLPAVVQLAEDRQWRVRLATIEYIPLLAEQVRARPVCPRAWRRRLTQTPRTCAQLGAELFDQELAQLCASWLADSVFSIREVAIANMKKLIHVFGADWAQARCVPQITSARTHRSYLHRMTALVGARVLADVLPVDSVHTALYAAPGAGVGMGRWRPRACSRSSARRAGSR